MDTTAPVPTRQTALIIWGALCFGVATFAVVATFAGPGVRAGRAELPETVPWMAVAVAIAGLALSRWVPPRLRSGEGRPPGAMALTRIIVTAALNESPALLAIIVWMLSGSAVALVALAIAAVGLLLVFPSAARWDALCAAPPAGAAGPPNRMVR